MCVLYSDAESAPYPYSADPDSHLDSDSHLNRNQHAWGERLLSVCRLLRGSNCWHLRRLHLGVWGNVCGRVAMRFSNADAEPNRDANLDHDRHANSDTHNNSDVDSDRHLDANAKSDRDAHANAVRR